MGDKSGIEGKTDEQYKLLDVEPAKDPTKAENGNAGVNDPAFVGNKMLPVHRGVPWIAGFASEFIRDTCNRYLSSKGTILAPFSGVGKTMVEALLAGHDGVFQSVKELFDFGNSCILSILLHQPHGQLRPRVKQGR